MLEFKAQLRCRTVVAEVAVDNRIREFLQYLADEKGYAQNTIAAYQNDLIQLAEYLQNRFPPGDEPAELWPVVTKSAILGFILHLKEHNYAPSTLARKVAAVRSFFKYLRRRGVVSADPTEEVDGLKVARNLPRTLTPAEVDALLAAPARRRTPEAKRDRAMLELLYATGMRVSELIGLNIDDVNLMDESVRCVGRNRRERVFPLPRRAFEALEEYIQTARPLLLRDLSERALFVNRRGERLTRQGFWLIVKTYAREARIDRPITPHTFRHTFAAHTLQAGADIESVQKMLGHVSIATTQVYERLRQLQNQGADGGGNPA